MSLQTDIIFVKALRSNEALLAKLASGDVYNTSIALPDKDMENAPMPYAIVSFDGLQNEDTTKDSYEGLSDRVQISIEVAAEKRPQLAELVMEIRKTVREFFENILDSDEDYDLVPLDYAFSAQAVQYDPDKPCFWQTLQYQCDTNRKYFFVYTRNVKRTAKNCRDSFIC